MTSRTIAFQAFAAFALCLTVAASAKSTPPAMKAALLTAAASWGSPACLTDVGGRFPGPLNSGVHVALDVTVVLYMLKARSTLQRSVHSGNTFLRTSITRSPVPVRPF